MPRKGAAAVAGILFLLAAVRLNATQITWASNALATNLESGGAALDETFVFFLGTFAPGFTPGADLPGQWAAHWTTLEATAYNPTTRRFAEVTEYAVNPPGFPTGAQGYIWGTNGRCGAGEWILLTNPAWTFPAGAGGPGAPALTWSASQASQVILGKLGEGGVHLRTAPAGTAAPPALSPAAWRSVSFTAGEQLDPLVSGWEADPDGDRASNLMEYACGTPPKMATRNAFPSAVVTPDGTRLEVTLARDCRARAVWIAQESVALSGWMPVAADMLQEPATPAGFRLSFPLSPATRRFVRFSLALP